MVWNLWLFLDSSTLYLHITKCKNFPRAFLSILKKSLGRINEHISYFKPSWFGGRLSDTFSLLISDNKLISFFSGLLRPAGRWKAPCPARQPASQHLSQPAALASLWQTAARGQPGRSSPLGQRYQTPQLSFECSAAAEIFGKIDQWNARTWITT